MRFIFARSQWVLCLALATSYGEAQTRPLLFEKEVNWASSGYNNVWEDVTLSAVLTSPSQRQVQIGGFYYAQDTWKFRFAPNEGGQWSWTATITDGIRSSDFAGTFFVHPDSVSQFVRQSAVNPFRWTLTNGKAFYPVGMNDCVYNRRADSNVIDPDGPIRFWSDQRIVEKEEYFQTFAQGGVNLFRWGPDNCAVSLYDDIAPAGNRYREADARRIDDMLQVIQQNNIRTYQVLFGFNPPYGRGPTAEQMNAVKRYLKYMVDRYGALVDFWELMNEAQVDQAWYNHAIDYLQTIDPYRHPITTSWELAQHPGIQLNSPHWYQLEAEQDSDLITAQNMSGWKAAGKPVIVGEQGNAFRSWDNRSGLRMRLRLWTAMFSEGSLMFWNSARFIPEEHPDGGAANIYLGPEERAYMRILSDFSEHVAPDALACPVTGSQGVRAYGLCAKDSLHLYVHYFADHSTEARQSAVWLAAPLAGTLVWIQPQTGAVISRSQISAGWQQINVPAFTVDVAAFLLRTDSNSLPW